MTTSLRFTLCVVLFFEIATRSTVAEEPRPIAPPLPENSPPNTPALVAGKPMPAFWTLDSGGTGYGINDSFIRKHWVLLEFWSLRGDRGKDQARMAALRQHFLAEDRLLILSINVDEDFEEWMHYMQAQKPLTRLDGSRVGFHTDNRWWQWWMGSHSPQEFSELLEKFGLQQDLPQFVLIRPNEILAAKHIPADKVREVVNEHLKPAAGERPKGGKEAPAK